MPNDENLWLEKQLCFALYAATNAITRSYRPPLAESGLTYPQYLVLVTLLERPSMTSGEMARALHLDAGTLTPMLKRLSSSGLIERTRRRTDERIIDNRLSTKGRALQESLAAAQQKVVGRTGLAPGQLNALRDALNDLTVNLLRTPHEELKVA